MYIGDLRISSMRVDNANDGSVHDEEEGGRPKIQRQASSQRRT